jgi:dihydroxyacid dehydratase/phosphogluconate dehydratase
MEAMRYSLASRDLIADCIEMMHEVRKVPGCL